MVLQRGIQIPVWGNAGPGSRIPAELDSVRRTAKAYNEGRWTIRFPKFKAGGPYTFKIYESGKTKSGIMFKEILIGDVRLASGQSNNVLLKNKRTYSFK